MHPNLPHVGSPVFSSRGICDEQVVSGERLRAGGEIPKSPLIFISEKSCHPESWMSVAVAAAVDSLISTTVCMTTSMPRLSREPWRTNRMLSTT